MVILTFDCWIQTTSLSVCFILWLDYSVRRRGRSSCIYRYDTTHQHIYDCHPILQHCSAARIIPIPPFSVHHDTGQQAFETTLLEILYMREQIRILESMLTRLLSSSSTQTMTTIFLTSRMSSVTWLLLTTRPTWTILLPLRRMHFYLIYLTIGLYFFHRVY